MVPEIQVILDRSCLRSRDEIFDKYWLTNELSRKH